MEETTKKQNTQLLGILSIILSIITILLCYLITQSLNKDHIPCIIILPIFITVINIILYRMSKPNSNKKLEFYGFVGLFVIGSIILNIVHLLHLLLIFFIKESNTNYALWREWIFLIANAVYSIYIMDVIIRKMLYIKYSSLLGVITLAYFWGVVFN